jgi:tRNA(fMet)-specific endonuclease VapC
MKYLLDTSFVIQWTRGDTAADKAVDDTDTTHLSVITLGELLAGEVAKGIAALQEAMSSLRLDFDIIEADTGTAYHFACISHQLQNDGKMIPQNDIWIAATAMRHELTLLTFDQHFRRVEGLDVKVY